VELLEEVDVAGDEVVFGDDGAGVAKVEEDLEAAAGELEFAFDGLVGIGDAADGDGLGLPGFFGEFFAEEVGGGLFDEDFGFEVEACGEAEIFVGGAGVAVDAAVGAAAIGVEAVREADVGAVVGGDDGFGGVEEILGWDFLPTLEVFCVAFDLLEIVVDADGDEAVGRVGVCAAAFDCEGSVHGMILEGGILVFESGAMGLFCGEWMFSSGNSCDFVAPMRFWWL